MAKGISLHIGVNVVDPEHYGSDCALDCCHADAEAMLGIAEEMNFDASKILRSEEATTDRVSAEILEAARSLSAGDLFFLSYAGHGGQVRDVNGDERAEAGGKGDNCDETWALYNRQLIDDELAVLWAEFEPGTRILVLSDSCHSGTATRGAGNAPEAAPESTYKKRALTRKQCGQIYRREAATYDTVQLDLPEVLPKAKASVLLLSGCQDKQESGEDTFVGHGLFTSQVVNSWRDAESYFDMYQTIVEEMPDDQTPNWYPTGKKDKGFYRQKPFTR